MATRTRKQTVETPETAAAPVETPEAAQPAPEAPEAPAAAPETPEAAPAPEAPAAPAHVDVVAMPSLRADGTPDQTEGFVHLLADEPEQA